VAVLFGAGESALVAGGFAALEKWRLKRGMWTLDRLDVRWRGFRFCLRSRAQVRQTAILRGLQK
jgi:hypothetical protein